MNYYKQVAEMLGVELNEKFMLKDEDNDFLPRTYRITDEGLMFEFGGVPETSRKLLDIISGRLTIVKFPWKPKTDEIYYYYSPYEGLTFQEIWLNTAGDYCMWKIGNCFRTREEAQTKGKEIMESIEKEYRES